MEHVTQAERWAEEEFGGVALGDTRRTDRLVRIASGLAGQTGASISSVCGKSGAQTVSRLLGRAETTLESVTRSHVKQTGLRCTGESRILAVQDTTVLDFTTHPATQGIGPVTTSAKSRGLLMHTVLALSLDRVPLGLLGVQVWAREESERGCAKRRRSRAIADKESNKWLVGLEQAQSATAPEQSMLVIGDRESDVFALFVAPRRPNVDLLVRLAHNRAIEDTEYAYVHDAIANASVVGTYEIEVPRQGKRAKRQAKLDVRVARVRLRAPRHRTADIADTTVEVSLVWVLERNAPEDVEPLDWSLLTTESVESYEQAVEMIRFYAARWTIEEFHRVLKSGCRVEHVQFETVDRILPAIGILAVVAWRVLHLTKLARSQPDLSVETVAVSEEVTVLSQWLEAQGEAAVQIRTVKEFGIAVARLGGFQGRKSDGMPGTKTTWQGLRNLEMLVLGYRLATQNKM